MLDINIPKCYTIITKRKGENKMKIFILGVIMTIWVFMGIISPFFDKQFRGVNVPMILFMAFVPFIPWLAHWCGLF